MKSWTREAWLEAAGKALADSVFAEIEVPEFRISVGWPGGRGKKASVIGQCWNTSCSEDEKAQVFISPVLLDGVEILQCLAHEMIHVIDNCQHGHRGLFLTLFRRVGFVGKATECVAGPELVEKLQAIAKKLDDFPHSRMKRPGEDGGKTSGPAPQKNRNLLVECADCGYKVRTSSTNLIERGAPICPCNMEPMIQKEGN